MLKLKENLALSAKRFTEDKTRADFNANAM